MKYLFFLTLLLQLENVFSQSYSCIPSEHKTYYTNPRGYLRGMRIDSVKYNNGDTLYYPFRTARLDHCTWGPIADTSGGSWWGKTLIQTPSGSTRIPNRWGDTITIRNNALLNDTWIFYHDTTAVYYEAQVIAWDTMTFLGLTDSVKRIRITAKNGASTIPSNPLNGLELLISKQYGWIQAIDCYLFPYHVPGDTLWSNWSFDCYFVEANRGSPIMNDNSSLDFKRVTYIPPVSDEVYNFEIGDAFWLYETMDLSGSSFRTTETKTLITGKAISDTLITYTLDYWSKSKGHSPPTAYEYYSGTKSQSYTRGRILADTIKMPEEWYDGHYYYYLPEDSSYCYRSPVYSITIDRIFGNGYYLGNAVEPSFPAVSYKIGLGMRSSTTGGSAMLNPPQSRYSLEGAQKGGSSPCDPGNGPVSVTQHEGAGKSELQLYPNPADDRLEVTIRNAPVNSRFKLELYNSCGTMVFKKDYTAGSCVLRLGDLPTGLYIIKIYTEQGTANSKLIIRR